MCENNPIVFDKNRHKYLAVPDIFLNTPPSTPPTRISPRLKNRKYSKKIYFRPSATLTDGGYTHFSPSATLTDGSHTHFYPSAMLTDGSHTHFCLSAMLTDGK